MEDVNIVEGMERIPYTRVVRDRSNPFELFEDEEFRRRFRFTKHVVLEIADLIEDDIITSSRNASISPVIQTLIFLRFTASCGFHTITGDFFGIHKSTASRVIHRVASALGRYRETFIKFDTNSRRTKEEFYDIAHFPGVQGCIDCTHVPISQPSSNDFEIYRNRKGFFSINVQIVSDADLRISNIVCRWPGSTHDARIFDNSVLCARFEDNQFEGTRCVQKVLFGSKENALLAQRSG